MKEAMLYESLTDSKVKCNLCAHRCIIKPGKWGICQVRENRDGILYTHVYGRSIAMHVDPIEKKPLYHFLPGSKAFSVGAPGCNFKCRFCQNCEIAHIEDRSVLEAGKDASPEQLVEMTKQSGCDSIAYTYTEPTIFFEYTYDTARLAHEAGLKNVYVSNGFMTPEMIETIAPYLDAINVDLKGFRDDIYRRIMGGRLQPVLGSMRLLREYGIFLEVTSLIIPEMNDSPAELHEMAHFVADELGTDVPWHISRFFPGYKMTDVPSTPMNTLQQAKEAGREAGLEFIYVGNVPYGEDVHTRCPGCGAVLIERSGFGVLHNYLKGDQCPKCGRTISLVI